MYANRLIADLLITITILVFLFLGILLAAWSAAQLITLPVLFFKRYFRFGDEALTTTFAESVNDLQGTNVPLEVEYLHDIDFEISPRDLNQDNHYPLKSVKAISFTCCALGSGSKGNSFYFRTDNFGVLIDIGLGPSQMKQRMSLINIGWQDINAVVLTHTDTDHWNPRTFRQLNKLQIPVYCHHDHLIHLSKDDSFISLQQCGLTRLYYTNETLRLSSLLKCRPFRLSHDGGATFGFRFDCGEGASASSISLGYAADLGSWDKETAVALSNVDVLALEFNYDLDMQLASSRMGIYQTIKLSN